jgi:serine protease AprX
VLQKYPNLAPDTVKRFFQQNGLRVAGTESAQGGGEMRLGTMLGVAPTTTYSQKVVSGSGTGTIEGARGQDHLTRDGVVLSGERDIFGQPVKTASLASLESASSSWSAGSWNGSSWSGSSWSGSSWSGSSWSGSSWSGSSWSGSSWSGSSWSGSSWSGSSWSGSSWSGSSWSGGSWASASWG